MKQRRQNDMQKFMLIHLLWDLVDFPNRRVILMKWMN